MQPAQSQKAVALRHAVEDPGDRLRLRIRLSLTLRLGLPLRLGLLHAFVLVRLAARPLESGIDGLRAASGPLSAWLLPLIRAAAFLDRLDQIVPRQHAVTRNPELPGALVEEGEMFVPKSHQAPQC